MLEYKKAIFRWKQFGGWRMIKAYIRLGVLHVFIKEVFKVVFSKRPLKMAYPGVSKKIEPIIRKQYSPLLKILADQYGDKAPTSASGIDRVFGCAALTTFNQRTHGT